MKQAIYILFIQVFLILLGSFANPQPVSAVPAGEACCPEGYSFMHGACMSQRVVTTCGLVSAAMCAVNQHCDVYLDLCFRAYSSGVSVDGFCNFMVSPGRESYEIEKRACESIQNLIFQAQDHVIDTVCDPGLACGNNVCTNINIPGIFNLCGQAEADNNGENPCTTCYKKKGIWTAVGCLPTVPEDIIPQLVRFFIGFAGGVALLLMLIGAFRLSVSAGNPDALKAAKEMITNAIAGLVIIIFSAVLLQVIGVQILQVPGF